MNIAYFQGLTWRGYRVVQSHLANFPGNYREDQELLIPEDSGSHSKFGLTGLKRGLAW